MSNLQRKNLYEKFLLLNRFYHQSGKLRLLIRSIFVRLALDENIKPLIIYIALSILITIYSL